jgi:hypothetical protein
MADVAALIARPPQYEQDPFYAAVLQQWLMANQGLTQKGVTRVPGSDNSALFGMLGELGGAAIGSFFGPGGTMVGSQLGGLAGGGSFWNQSGYGPYGNVGGGF